MKLTIKDLSKLSGYSVSTISRVLANSGNVKEETRQEIERLLVEHNYRSGSFGARISKTIQKIVMVVVNDLSNEFYLETIHKIQAVCNAAGYLPLVGISNSVAEMEEKYVITAQDMALAGIILMTPMETDNLRRLISASNTPVVLVNRYMRSMDLDVVCIDNYRGGYLATEHLIQRGAQHICHVAGPQNSSASRDRRRGFEDALQDYALPVSSNDIYQGDLLRSGGRAFAEHFIADSADYDGIFFANDMMAAGFIDVARQKGIRIPEDVSVVCFDDSPAVTEGPVPVTTVSIDGEILGEEAAKILLRRIDGSESKTTKLIYPPTLVERQSVRALV